MAGEIGAGQTTSRQLVTEGGTATLVCPTSGIDDPRTAWARIVTDEGGASREVPINASDSAFSITCVCVCVCVHLSGRVCSSFQF